MMIHREESIKGLQNVVSSLERATDLLVRGHSELESLLKLNNASELFSMNVQWRIAQLSREMDDFLRRH